MQIGANARTQWYGPGVPYNSFQVAGFYPILSKDKLTQFGAGGAYINVDKQPSGYGQINTTSFGIAGSYKLPVNFKNFFHCGIQLGYMSRNLSAGDIQTGSQVHNGYYDPNAPTNEPTLGTSRGAATIGLGTTWVVEDADREVEAQAGIAAYNLNAPNVSFYDSASDNLKRRYVLHGSIRAIKTREFSLYPSFRYIMQGPAHILNAGGLARFPVGTGSSIGPLNRTIQVPNLFGIGLFYQPNAASALIGVVEYSTANYAVSINYDLGTGSLKDGSKQGSAAEIFIAFRKILGKKRKVDLRFFDTDKNAVTPGGGESAPSQPAPPSPAPAPKPVAPTPAPAPAPTSPKAVSPTSTGKAPLITPQQRALKPAPTKKGTKVKSVAPSSAKTKPAAKKATTPKKVAAKPASKASAKPTGAKPSGKKSTSTKKK
jgi:type IX secretion system PorP/SprF family membrane protein